MKPAIIAAAIILVPSLAAAEESYGIDRSAYSVPVKYKSVRVRQHDANGNALGDPRPARWCGWWLRHQLGVADRSYNLARNWTRYGSQASSDCVNCIAVWPHHVGLVTGRPSKSTIVLKSGNDGGAVRERERPWRGVIAWRYPASFVLGLAITAAD